MRGKSLWYMNLSIGDCFSSQALRNRYEKTFQAIRNSTQVERSLPPTGVAIRKQL